MSETQSKSNEVQEASHECRSGVAALMMLVVVAMGAQGSALAQQPKTPEPHTEAAVVADDDGWGHAEETGDVGYVDNLLAPEYRSISADGSIHDKAAILANTKKSSPERRAQGEAWKTAHPEKTSVTITGDTAVLTFQLDRPGAEKRPVMSCDIFVYRDGRWRAIYSQHTTAGS